MECHTDDGLLQDLENIITELGPEHHLLFKSVAYDADILMSAFRNAVYDDEDLHHIDRMELLEAAMKLCNHIKPSADAVRFVELAQQIWSYYEADEIDKQELLAFHKVLYNDTMSLHPEDRMLLMDLVMDLCYM
jgi:hypothetical protein